MPKRKHRYKSKHPWYARKSYLHFDFALSVREASCYVLRPENIIRHKFSPFIHYTKSSRKISRNKEAEAVWKDAGKPERLKPKLIVKDKDRNIFYASHVDGYIYSYYAHKIQLDYCKYLHENGLDSIVIAYRSIERNGTKYSNIHFARDAFSFLIRHKNLNVSCYDLSKFFDRLDPNVLKVNWAKILGVAELPADHDVLHRQLTNFTFVEEGDLVERFRDRFLENPRNHGLDVFEPDKKNRICTYKELRDLHSEFKKDGKKLIKPKGSLDITGIAQGSTISGLLANIFMLEFDFAFKQIIEGMGGLYLRYSDDIFVAYPTTCTHAKMYQIISDLLVQTCGESVKINVTKTEDTVVREIDGNIRVFAADGLTPARIQYLGFHLSSSGIHIRNSSVSKDRGKTVQAIASAHRRKQYDKIDTRAVYKSKSHRQATSWNPLDEKGFMAYAIRSARIFANSGTINRQLRKSDKFIRRAVARRRERIMREGL